MQGPPPPRSRRTPEPRRAAPRWSDEDPGLPDEEELPPWAGLAIDPRWADQSTNKGATSAAESAATRATAMSVKTVRTAFG